MNRRYLLSIVLFLLGTAWTVPAQTAAPAAAKQMKKDEVYFSLARKLNSINESPASALVSELDGLIEITGIVMGPDGKATVTVKERAPSSAAYTNKSTRLLFVPPATGDKWTWEQFEENRKFYAADKLFPYTKDELGRRRQSADQKWGVLIGAISKQGESAQKLLETVKVVIKAEPPPMASLAGARNALAEALKEKRNDDLLNAYREIQLQTDPIKGLADSYPDLKANDAFLRLNDEFKNAINMTASARRDYVQAVAAYNESLVRLPYALAAYALQFTKIEANLGEE